LKLCLFRPGVKTMTASLFGHHRANSEAKLKALPLCGEKEFKGGIPTRKETTEA